MACLNGFKQVFNRFHSFVLHIFVSWHRLKLLLQVDLKGFSTIDSLLKVIFVIIEEGKELFRKSLKSCFVFVEGKTFKESAVFDPSIKVDTFTTVEVLEVYTEEVEADKMEVVVEMNKLGFTVDRQPAAVEANIEELDIGVLEVCIKIAVAVIQSSVGHKEAELNKEATLFHESTISQFLRPPLIHKDCILGLEGCQYFFFLSLSRHCNRS